MSKKYVCCPTCGGMASFLSKNWEQSGLVVTIERINNGHVINDLQKEIERLNDLLDENKTITMFLEALTTKELLGFLRLKMGIKTPIKWSDLNGPLDNFDFPI